MHRLTIPCLLVALGAAAGAATVQSPDMSVEVSDTFPQVIQYQWKTSGAIIHGQDQPLTEVVINGEAYTPRGELSAGRREAPISSGPKPASLNDATRAAAFSARLGSPPISPP